MEQPGLRERKKARTRRTISSTAIALFCEHGYDAVSVAQVAEAAAQIVATERVLAAANQNRVLAGTSSADLLPTALDETDRAYAMLAGGLTPFAPA